MSFKKKLGWINHRINLIYKRHICRDVVSNPYDYIHVDPNSINYSMVNNKYADWILSEEYDSEVHQLFNLDKARFLPRYNTGLILDGDWDKSIKQMSDEILYSSLCDHYIRDIPLDETQYFQICLDRINKGYSVRGYTTKKEFMKEYPKDVNSLFKNIKKNGLLTTKEISGEMTLNNELSVNIGRDGEIIFNNDDGNHRLSISKILGLSTIPVLVTVRHSDWQKIRKEIVRCSNIDQLSERAKTHLSHPDIAFIRRETQI